MGTVLAVVAAAVGGLAFWRRKKLRTDAERVTEVAKSATAKVTSGSSRKSLLLELGEAVYSERTDPDVDVAADIDRLVIDLRELEEPATEGTEAASAEAADAPSAGA
jgi:hypothetical protein